MPAPAHRMSAGNATNLVIGHLSAGMAAAVAVIEAETAHATIAAETTVDAAYQDHAHLHLTGHVVVAAEVTPPTVVAIDQTRGTLMADPRNSVRVFALSAKSAVT